MRRFTLIVLAAASAPAAAQYSAAWYTADAGGGISTGDGYRLRCTIAQPDAGGPLLGDGYSLTGGFWSQEPYGCVADFNRDRSLDTQDVLAFLNAWRSGREDGDINGDGLFDSRDIAVFLNLWVAGCD